MIKNKQHSVVDEQALKMYMGAQIGVPSSYSPSTYFGECSRCVEEQSSFFLEQYVNDEIVLSEKAEQDMPDYFAILRRSHFKPIRKILNKAEKKYKENVIKRYKEKEKRMGWIKSKFSILQNKKAMAKMSSADMLAIAELLEQETDYSTKRMQDRLRSYAIHKIDRTIKNDIPADENIDKLTRRFGTFQQKDYILKHFLNGKKSDQQEISAKEKKDGWFKRKWKHIKKGLVVIGITTLGLLGGKTAFNQLSDKNSSDSFSQTDITEQTITPPSVDKIDITETKQQADIVNQDFLSAIDNLNKAYKDRFDSALEIHLGEEKRDLLYQKIDKLREESKIEFKNGTTREWYAYAFTMYAKIAPYSDGGKLITELLAGKDVDKKIINDLVISAKRDGTGISGTGSNSAFDKAPQELQKKHIQNRQNVRALEKMAQKSR